MGSGGHEGKEGGERKGHRNGDDAGVLATRSLQPLVATNFRKVRQVR
jgi:hypothetical protein